MQCLTLPFAPAKRGFNLSQQGGRLPWGKRQSRKRATTGYGSVDVGVDVGIKFGGEFEDRAGVGFEIEVEVRADVGV